MRALSLVAARRWWPLALGVLLGVLVGLLVSLLGSRERRAEASVLISSPAGPEAVTPMLSNLRELATSGVVAGNVKSTLRLTRSTQELRRHLRATVRPQSQVIAISATDSLADHARQIAQEAAVVFAQLVDTRFGTAKPALQAAVLDSAHVLSGPDRHLIRNGLIGALVGLLLGSATMFVLASGTRRAVAAGREDDLSRREGLLEQRVDGATARERALAGRAGKLAAREQEFDARAAKVAAAEREVGARERETASSQQKLADLATEIAVRKRELEALAFAPPPPLPEPVSAPEAEAEPAPPARAGTWNLNELQKAVDTYTGATAEQAETWKTYLYFLRGHASPDGSLPRSFDPLIADVFGEIVRHGPFADTMLR